MGLPERTGEEGPSSSRQFLWGMQTEVSLSSVEEQHKSNMPFLSQEDGNLFPSITQQTSSNSEEDTFSYLMEMTYSRHCLTPFSGFVLSLKCSINFGKRLKRNQRPALSFSLKGPNLVFHLSSTFPKPDLPQNWLCVS